MARIAGVDLPREKRIEIGLTYIYGIGRPSADKILAQANAPSTTKAMFLSFTVKTERTVFGSAA